MYNQYAIGKDDMGVLILLSTNYNEKVAEYNKKVQSFPSYVIANICGFEPAQYFEASEESHTAPVVEF